MKRCLKCKSEWPDTARFCPKDGARLLDPPAAEEAADLDEEQTEELAAEDEAKLDQQRQHGFSETQWFMLAQKPEKLKEKATAEDLYELQDDYDWDEELPEEERKQFSLRKKKD